MSRLKLGFLVFTVPFQVQFVGFSLEREKEKILQLYSVALDNCEVQSWSNDVEKKKRN